MGVGSGELDVAIIGMAGRFPGAKNIEMLWENLVRGKESITFFSDEELLQAGVDAALLQNPNYVKAAAMLDNEDLFDAEFFGYSGREAARMDPQGRLFLECAWEALECAGYAPYDYEGPIGVYASQSINTYLLYNVYPHLNLDEFMLSYQNIQQVLSNLNDFLATRVSYKLNLKGPSINVQCACSSSLVAVHLACQSLINGECQMALAGGVSLYLPQKRGYLYEEGMILSPDGHCRAFDAESGGTIFGRGVGVVVLKPLEDAVHDGDLVLAVIKGSAMNNDGANKVGFTAPSVEGQAKVIAEALTLAGVGAETISYIEAHGTGTTQGDPIEVAALTRVFRNYTDRNGFCALGTVKSNFGHLDAAAGITGLIKTTLMLMNKKLPPSLHYRNPNPQIDFEHSPFYVCSSLQEWEKSGGFRRAGVSAFGMGGTNAHIILEEAPEMEVPATGIDRSAHLLTLSAKNEKALQRLAERYMDHLKEDNPARLADICFTSNNGRTHFDHRLAMVTDDLGDLPGKLAAFSRGSCPTGVYKGQSKTKNVPRVVFLFTGQGSQSVGMGRQLYETQPTFRQVLEQCDALLRGQLQKPLLEVIYPPAGEESPLQETAYTQPALFALEYALYELWRSWGIEPLAVMGHSVGEYVAACAAGVFSLEEGLRLVAERGRLIQALPKDGEMAAVFAGEEQVAAVVTGYEETVSIAGINGPKNTVISGTRESLGRILQKLEAEGIAAQRLAVSHAFHSPLLEPMLDAFERAASEVTYSLPRIGLMSNVTGCLVTGNEVSNAAYWRRHVRAPVQFYRSLQALHERGEEIFVELGPHPVLLGMGAQCFPKGEGVWLPSLRRGRDDWQQMLESLAELYVRGVKVAWPGFDRDYRRRRVSLPTYPFEPQRHWLERKGPGPADVPVKEENDLSDWLFKMEWQDVPRLSKSGKGPVSAEFLPSPSQIYESMAPELGRLAVRYDLDVYARMAVRFNALCVAYILSAFRKMGLEFQVDFSFRTQDLVNDLGIASRHGRLIERFMEVLANTGILVPYGEGWKVIQAPGMEDPETLRSKLLKEYPACRHELGFVAQTGKYLAECLRGETDPLQLLFPEGDISTSENLYQESTFARVFNTLVQKAVRVSLASLPAGRKVRIIEIGAGTGGTTSYILPDLPPIQAEYVFTDVSPLFLEKARKKFSNYPFVQYEIFDVEKDPASQGIAFRGFDIVIAANVIHATRDLMESLHYIREILAPGGLLISLEVTAPQLFADLTVGLLEGWWRFSDFGLRPSYPLLSEDQWVRLMEKAGFSDAVSIPEHSLGEGDLSQQAVLLGSLSESTDEAQGRGLDASGINGEGDWVIFADRQGLGEKLAGELEARNGKSTLVFADQTYRKEPGRYLINPGLPEDMNRLFREVMRDGRRPLTRVVYLWALDDEPMEETNLAQFADQQKVLCGSVLLLVQTLTRSTDGTMPSLLLVTRGSQALPTGPGVGHPESSTLWGLGRVIAREHPQLACTCIDLDPADESKDEDDLEALAEEILFPDGETQIAYRGRRRYAARLSSYPSSEERGISAGSGGRSLPGEGFSTQASYLITGGLGGLGLRFARWMVEQGARHLILMGRNAPSPPAQQMLKALEQAGAKLTITRGDVSREMDIVRILEDCKDRLPPLRGILHCAGVLEDGVLLRQDWGRFEKVFAPKVFGGFNLHRLTEHIKLDFFVLFSSVASLLGLAGQGNHAAANAFLDALAGYRRARGLPAISINWGPWSEVGAATQGNLIEKIRSQGMEVISPEIGMKIFERVFLEDPTQIAAGRMDWKKFLDQSFAGTIPPLFRKVFEYREPAEKKTPKEVSPPPDFGKQLLEAPPGSRKGLLQSHVVAQIREALRLDVGKPIDPQQPLSELGLDSLLAIELRNRISLSLGLKRSLPATLLFDYPTLETITQYLAEKVLFLADVLDAGSAKEEDSMLTEIALLSDAEAEALLLDEIATGKEGT